MPVVDESGKTWVVGRVSGKRLEGDQAPGMPHAICHACGLGYRCWNEDCPNDRPAPNDPLFGPQESLKD